MALTDTYPPDYKKMYESALGTVNNTYQTQMDALNQQQAAMPYQYQQQKNQVAAQSGQTGQALDEANAQRGLYNSGTARTDLARNYAARDTGINDINNQQNQAVQALRDQMNQLGAQRATSISALQGQEGQDARNFTLSEANLTGNYNGQQTLAGRQVSNQASQFAQSQAQQASQYAQGQAQQQSQFGQNLGLTQQQINNQSDQYNQGQTQQSSHFGQDLGLQQAQLAQQGNQYTTSNQLALLTALQDYNLGVGQITDTLPQFSNYNYGDSLRQLLAQLSPA